MTENVASSWKLSVPPRTIMTPGPVEVDPRVLRAMSMPILGQFDSAFTAIMNEVMEMLREVFQTKNHWAYPIDGTSRAGTEALLAALIEPGEKMLVPVFGRFGDLFVEIGERYGAEIHTMSCPWGTVFDPEEIISEIEEVHPKIVALVHGETSTGRMQPLDAVGRACREMGVLLVVDAVATFCGVDIKPDEWCIDAVIGGAQKCLSIPSGIVPITYNERVEKEILKRKKVERGIATDADRKKAEGHLPIRSNYFDLGQLQDYWSERRLNHHTEATSMEYALHEGLHLVLEEGLQNRFARHKLNAEALKAGIEGMGLELFGDPSCVMPTVTCVSVPEHVDADEVRNVLLKQFGIEIAGSFGSLQGKIWRIGTMGYGCRQDHVLAVLAGLEASLIRCGATVNRGDGLQAAMDVYDQNSVK
ncbi:pyridoxal-phosphate-dependent aminotransferase family protein [Sporolactobacillus pectinivorans]|uniref:pyridoxal-phosphate-dependent aminotransferase family protein n=1 Tax=Sporolactobacillus pectinivorans TaxID=1591408 RepID=UPI00187425D6|nr:alanine--glyoxylate aminotransferase family protein [Sporolactobacillus pectinivorans]